MVAARAFGVRILFTMLAAAVLGAVCSIDLVANVVVGIHFHEGDIFRDTASLDISFVTYLTPN